MLRTSTVLGLTLGGFIAFSFSGCSSDSDGKDNPGTGGSSASGGTGGSSAAGTPNNACGEVCNCDTTTGTCIPGCKEGSHCDSGLCGDNGDCERCVSDQECSEGRVCGTGVCHAPCTGDGECGGQSCCDGHCVNTALDVNHCGACGAACTAKQFCSSGGATACADAIFANVCKNASVAIVLDGQADNDAAAGVIQAAFAKCSPAPTVESVKQNVASGVLDVASGRAIAGPGKLIAVAGGDFTQKYAQYVKKSRIAFVWDELDGDAYNIYQKSGTGEKLLATYNSKTELTATHDVVTMQLVRDPTNGTLGMLVYGGYGTGTAAGAWYFSNAMVPKIDTFTDSWYILEWTDKDAAGPTSEDEFVKTQSGK